MTHMDGSPVGPGVSVPPQVEAMDIAELGDEELWEIVKPLLPGDVPDEQWAPLLAGENSKRIAALFKSKLAEISAENDARSVRLDSIRKRALTEGPLWRARFLTYETEYCQWRRSTGRLRKLISKRRRMANNAVAALSQRRGQERRVADRRSLRSLALAVERHRGACIEDGLEPTEADLELWANLERLSANDGDERRSLAEMISTTWLDDRLS